MVVAFLLGTLSGAKVNRHERFVREPSLLAALGYAAVYHEGGSRHIVYGLGNKGGTLLQQECGVVHFRISWGEKNRAVGRIFLEHALLVSEVMATLELACRRRGIRLIRGDELIPQGQPSTFRWRVKLNGQVTLGVIPDQVFALEYPDARGATERAYFFLEADRGTMPVVRRHLAQTSCGRWGSSTRELKDIACLVLQEHEVFHSTLLARSTMAHGCDTIPNGQSMVINQVSTS